MGDWLEQNGPLLGLALLDGIASAALIFMVAVGLNLVFGVLRVLNVAHGSLFAIGAYAAASLGLFLASAGLPAWASLPALLLAALLVGVVLGPLIERVLLRRIYGEEPVLQLLVTFALFMILEDAQKLVWGVQPVSFSTPVSLLGTVDVPFGADVIPYNTYQVILLPAVAVATLVGLALFLRRTLTGRVILAVTTDREAATAMGIDARRVYLLTFTCGAGARGARRGSVGADLLPRAGDRRVHHRALLRGGRNGRARADRGRGADRAADRHRAIGRRHLQAGAGGGGALPHHGGGAAGAAAGAVRRGGDAPGMTQRRLEVLLAALGVAALVLAAWTTPWLKFVLTIALAKGIATLGILLLLRAGQVSFGHALYVAVGAYSVAFLAPALPDTLLLLPVAAAVATALGLLIGLFVSRYREIFFGMLNLALSMVFYSMLEKFYHLTKGTDGLRVPPLGVLGQALDRVTYEWASSARPSPLQWRSASSRGSTLRHRWARRWPASRRGRRGSASWAFPPGRCCWRPTCSRR
jgi:branched-chain amino acid transport system permease protein